MASKDVFNDSNTTPSASAPVTSTDMRSAPPQTSDDPISKEQDRLESLGDDAVRANSIPDDPGGSGNIDKSTLEGAAKLPGEGAP